MSRKIPKNKGFMNKGDVCHNCGYVFKKWAVSCPQCRKRVSSSADIGEKLRDMARKYLRKLEEPKDE